MDIPVLPEGCKPIPNFPGYCAHPEGYTLSCYNNKWGFTNTWRRLKSGTNNRHGRQVVVLTNASGEHSIHVHRLILLAFVGECPEGMEACHNNGNAGDNRLSNLRWDTKKANAEDVKRHGKRKGEHHPLAKITDDIVRQVREMASTGMTHQAIADMLSIQRRNAGRIIDRSRWSHVI